MKLQGVVVVGYVVLLAGCGAAATPAMSAQRETVTVTAPPTTAPVPAATVTVTPSENMNDPISTSDDDAEGAEVRLTTAQRAQCFAPGQDVLDRLYYDSPVPGINQKLQNVVAWRSEGSVFAAMVTDFGSGTFLLEPSVGVKALDSGAAAMTRYPLISKGDHGRLDPDDHGRDMARGCLSALGD